MNAGKVVIAGGSGLIGRALTDALIARGDRVWVLSRHPAEVQLPQGAEAVRWDGKTIGDWAQRVNEADAIINLAGANIGARPWTNERKRLIRSSRVESGQVLAEAVRQSAHKPGVFVQIAGVGYYGDQGDTSLDEQSPVGSDYLAGVAQDWENASHPVAEMGVRHVIMRTGVVLSPHEGVLAPFILQNKLFAGGPLGSGKQWVSWIHIRDLVRVFEFFLNREDAQGIYNATAPEPVTNAQFGRAVSSVMHRPYWLPAPTFALKAVLGEMSTLILEGQRVYPKRLLEMGFQFEFPTLRSALEDLIQ